MSAELVRLGSGAASSRGINVISRKKPNRLSSGKSRLSSAGPAFDRNCAPDGPYYAPEDYPARPISSLELGQPPFKAESPRDIQATTGQSTCFAMSSDTDESELKDEDGMPTRTQWESIVNKYLNGLHHRKRDKALISKSMHEMIYQTLRDPDATRLGTPQFRFWARKMFQLVEASGVLVITSGGRPVAVKEHIYDILCMCHGESGHAGRDKTCKVLRDYYTWIPKELTANFVKACPTCTQKRTGETAFLNRIVKESRASMDDPNIQKFRMVKHVPPHASSELREGGGKRGKSDDVSDSSTYSSAALASKSLKLDTLRYAPFSGFGNNLIPGPADLSSSRSSYDCLSGVPLSGICPNNVLPPLNSSSSMPEDIIDHGFVKHDSVSLPPLLQYLSGGVKIEPQSPDIDTGASSTSVSAVPIDPVLLNEEEDRKVERPSEFLESSFCILSTSAISFSEQEAGLGESLVPTGTSSTLKAVDTSFECNDKSLSSSSVSSAAVCTPNHDRAWTTSMISVNACSDNSELVQEQSRFILEREHSAPTVSP